MADKWEAELKEAIGKDLFRRAKKLYATGAVISYAPTEDGGGRFLIQEKDSALRRLYLPKVKLRSLKKNARRYDVYEAAALAHYLSGAEKESENEETAAASRPPTGTPTIPELMDELTAPAEAKLFLVCEKNAPDAPSSFERQTVSVRIAFQERVYIGNSGKLRQLRFDDSGTGNLKLSHFSPRDRQIIRFLTQYVEPEGSGYSLKADALAELMHCLVDYHRFFYDEKPLRVHAAPAEPTLSRAKDAHEELAGPALKIPEGVLPLEKPRVVTGKAGLWVGVGRDYWWVPAKVDAIWLKNFLSGGTRPWPTEHPFPDPEKPPVKTVFSKQAVVREKEFAPRYCLGLDAKQRLVAEILAAGEEPISEGSSVVRSGGKLYCKHGDAELNAGRELTRYGFLGKCADKVRTLEDLEAVGVFLEEVLPIWRHSGKSVFLSPELACYVDRPPAELTLRCGNPVDGGDYYELDYAIEAEGSGGCLWKTVFKAVRDNRRYLVSDTGRIVRASEALAEFLEAMTGVASPGKTPNATRVPKGAVIYWLRSAEKLPNAVPPEWEIFREFLTEKGHPKDPSPLPEDIIQGALREYQKDAIRWIRKMVGYRLNVILADEMGLGKTVQALALINNRRRGQTLPPVLLLCPTSLVENWEAEAARFTPNLKVLAVKGPHRSALIAEAMNYDLIVSSYALIKRDVERYDGLCFDFVILDEAQHIKNPGTANARACKTLRADHRLVLTGTPLENAPEDMWSIFDFLNPGMMGSLNHFKKRYSGIMEDKSSQRDLAARTAPFILRRLKNEVDRELPPKTLQTIYCEMGPEQRELYERLRVDGRRRHEKFIDGKAGRFEVLTALLRLRQLCCHPELLPPHERQGATLESAKTELVKELLFEALDSDHRVLVFSQFTTLLAILRRWLDSEAVPYEYLDGSTKNRQERVDRFNRDKSVNVFLLSLKAGGSGLNLTGADNVIIYDPWWNPSVEAQATDRTHRIGQIKPVTSSKIVLRDSVEEKILALQSRKQGLFNNVIENSASFSRLTDKDLEFLLK